MLHHGLWEANSKQAPEKASSINCPWSLQNCVVASALRASRTLMEGTSVVVNHQICGKLLQQPREVSELE